MSNYLHTPGPWITGNTDPLIFGRKEGNGTEPIGFVYGPSCPEYSEVGQRAIANARLIAAAPDLLEALKEIVEISEQVDGWQSFPIEPIERAYAVITKAIGNAK